jgi:hypothetical protein
MTIACCLLLAQTALTPAAATSTPAAAPHTDAPTLTGGAVDAPLRPLRLGLQATSARLDYRVTSRFAFGGMLSYTNLEGKEGRANNVLPELLLEYRIPLSGERWELPLRFAPGYLPKNGPTLRLGMGLGIALGETASLELVPLELMAWVNRERPEASLNGALAQAGHRCLILLRGLSAQLLLGAQCRLELVHAICFAPEPSAQRVPLATQLAELQLSRT